MAENLISALAPIREKTEFYHQHPDIVDDIIAKGNKKASAEALRTMESVREAITI